MVDNGIQASGMELSDKPVLAGRRIVIVLEDLVTGGAERQAMVLARYLVCEETAYVEAWALMNPRREVAFCEEFGIPWRIVPVSWRRDRVGRLRELGHFGRALRAARPDVILSYTMLPNVVCGLTWRCSGARLFIWNQRDAGLSRLGRKAEWLAVHRTPLFVSNSRHCAKFLVEELGAKPDRIRVIRNGICLDMPLSDRMQWRNQLGVSENCFLSCMLANIHSFKDHATLLRAWRIVVDRLEAVGGSAVLLLAGRLSDTHHTLKSLAYDLNLGRKVRFLGQVDDVSGLLQAVDLGVFSSRSEGCPNGVLECMASGLAIVGTDIPGISEAVGSEGFPFLAPVGDAVALANQILELAMNSKLRTELGRSNRRRIETDFRPESMCEKTVGLIIDALFPNG